MAEAILARGVTYEVYCITHVQSARRYIGCTTLGTMARFKDHIRMARWRPAGYLHKAIRKHGVEAFAVETLALCESKEQMLRLERELIAAHGTMAPRGYNMTAGGDGVFDPCEETRARMSAASRGRTASEETRRRQAEAASGKVFSEEHRRAIAAVRRGKQFSEAHRAAISAAKKGRPGASKGRKLSGEHREKLRRAALKQWADEAARERIAQARVGRLLSPETKAKVGIASAKRWADQQYREKMSRTQKVVQGAIAEAASDRMREKWADPEYRTRMLEARARARDARRKAA